MAEPKFDIENSPVPQIFELYGQNLNIRQIADQLGLHNTVVSFVVKHSNAKRRKRTPNRTNNTVRRTTVTSEQDQKIIELSANNTVREIAEILKLPQKTVYNACYRLGVKPKRAKRNRPKGGKYDDKIIELAPTHTKEQIATIIGNITPHGVYIAARRLGVFLKSKPTLETTPENKPEPKRTITARNKKFTLEQEQKIRELAPTHNKYELAKIVGLEPTQVYNLSLRLGVSIKHAKGGSKKGVPKKRKFETAPKKPKTPKTPPIHTIPSAPCEEQEYNHLIVHYKGTAKKQSINIPMESATTDKDVILDIVNKNRPRWTTSADIDCYKRDGIKYSTPHRKSAIKEDGKLVYGVEHNKKETS